jgi:hypothetical protein
MPAFVISPWARPGAVVHTRYDQYSAIRTIELILGMQPLSLFDALATPMYDAFTTRADLAPYQAIVPTQPLDQRNPVSPPVSVANFAMPGSAVFTPAGASARDLALALPFGQVDLVPQELSDAVLWHSVYGWDSTPPPPGPGASYEERARASVALDAYVQHRSIADALARVGA